MTTYLLRWLRVPLEPAAPDGSPDSILIFRAGKNYYRWRLVVWAMTRLTGFAGAFLGLGFMMAIPMPAGVSKIVSILALLVTGLLVVALSISYVLQRLNYELRWYIVTDRSLRIRSGIWSIEEITMTFANIQDLRITSGPLQGWLGLADLEVSSAGGGASAGGKHGGGSPTHQARFAGIDNAEAIRDLIVERLRKYRDASQGEAPADIESAAAELLAEARALRTTVT